MIAVTTDTWDALSAILAERTRQRDRWGDEHDDAHNLTAWSWLLARRANDLGCPFPGTVEDADRLLVEIAAIALAALEAQRRRRGSAVIVLPGTMTDADVEAFRAAWQERTAQPCPPIEREPHP